MPPPEIVAGVRESLKLLVNSHILKTVAMLKPSAKYNRRDCDHRRPSHWMLSNGNNSVLGYLKSIAYDVVAKYMARTVQRRFQYASEEESFERTHREDPRNC